MPPSPSRPSLFLQGVTCAASLIVVGVILALRPHAQDRLPAATVGGGPAVAITVEHAAPATLTLSTSVTAGPGIAELRTSSAVAVTLPSSWKEREVRNGSLRSVTSTVRSNATRWAIPPGVTVSFSLSAMPSGLTVHNTSPIPLLIVSKRIDVKTGKVDESSVLIKDMPVGLW